MIPPEIELRAYRTVDLPEHLFWQALHSTKVLVGDRAAPRVNPGLAMLRPLSPRVDAQTLADASLYVGPEPW